MTKAVADNTDTLSSTSSATFSNNYIGFTGREFDPYNTSFDNVFVRKYVSPGPDVTPGIEELNPQ